MLKVNILCAVAALMLSSAAHSVELSSGNYWLSVCQSNHPTDDAQCTAYVLGVWDGLTVAERVAKTKSSICSPKGVSARQAADIFVQYLRGNPGVRHMAGRVLIVASLMDAFPCRNGAGD